MFEKMFPMLAKNNLALPEVKLTFQPLEKYRLDKVTKKRVRDQTWQVTAVDYGCCWIGVESSAEYQWLDAEWKRLQAGTVVGAEANPQPEPSPE